MFQTQEKRGELQQLTFNIQKKSEGGNKGNHLLGFNEIERKWGPFGSYTTKGLSLSHYFEKKLWIRKFCAIFNLATNTVGMTLQKNGGKMRIRLYSGKYVYPLQAWDNWNSFSPIYSTHCSLCTIGFAIQKPICLYLTNELVFPWRMWSLTSRQTGCQDVLATQCYELSCRSLQGVAVIFSVFNIWNNCYLTWDLFQI